MWTMLGRYAIKVQVEPISYNHAYELVNAYHYLGPKQFIGQYAFGLIQDIQVIGAVVYSPLSVPNSATSAFGFPRGHYPDLLEMSRLVLEPELNGKNYGSILVGRSLRLLKQQGIRAVISYADSDRHIGGIYQACNFGYYGLSPQKSDFYFDNGRKLSRGKSKGLEGQWLPRSRKHRYIYLLDKTLKPIWEQLPYPKLSTGAKNLWTTRREPA
jgi:GNAT superfamily N-acetyltransferase